MERNDLFYLIHPGNNLSLKGVKAGTEAEAIGENAAYWRGRGTDARDTEENDVIQ